MGGVGKSLAKAGKTAMKEKKKLDKGAPKKDAGPDLNGIVEEGSTILDEYKAALSETAFNSEVKLQSYSSISTLFNTPDNIGGGDGAPATAYKLY